MIIKTKKHFFLSSLTSRYTEHSFFYRYSHKYCVADCVSYYDDYGAGCQETLNVATENELFGLCQYEISFGTNLTQDYNG